MKKQIVFILATCFVATVAAQSPHVAPIGVIGSGSEQTISLPQTELEVQITVRTEQIVTGPYARYAQKYLGVIAPLTDRTSSTIESATIRPVSQVIPAAHIAPAIPKATSHLRSENGFPKVLPDKMSNTPLSLEESARAAADRIYALRKARIELITGEAGENVFGAGLKTALEEIDRMENDYLSLFLGRQIVSSVVKCFTITPSSDKQTYIVCRFSPQSGVLPDDDLSGQPVILELKPSGTVNTAEIPVSTKPSKTDRQYRIADEVACRLIFDNKTVAAATLPIFQFGTTVSVASR